MTRKIQQRLGDIRVLGLKNTAFQVSFGWKQSCGACYVAP